MTLLTLFHSNDCINIWFFVVLFLSVSMPFSSNALHLNRIIIKIVTPCSNVCIFYFYLNAVSHNEISRYSSEEISGNESNEATIMTESERQAEINRQKEEMKLKRRKKKRTSSSMQSSTFKGKFCAIGAYKIEPSKRFAASMWWKRSNSHTRAAIYIPHKYPHHSANILKLLTNTFFPTHLFAIRHGKQRCDVNDFCTSHLYHSRHIAEFWFVLFWAAIRHMFMIFGLSLFHIYGACF